MKHIALLAVLVALGLTTTASAARGTEAPNVENTAPATLDLAVLTGR